MYENGSNILRITVSMSSSIIFREWNVNGCVMPIAASNFMGFQQIL